MKKILLAVFACLAMGGIAHAGNFQPTGQQLYWLLYLPGMPFGPNDHIQVNESISANDDASKMEYTISYEQILEDTLTAQGVQDAHAVALALANKYGLSSNTQNSVIVGLVNGNYGPRTQAEIDLLKAQMLPALIQMEFDASTAAANSIFNTLNLAPKIDILKNAITSAQANDF